MKRKGIDYHILFDDIKEDERWQDLEFLKPLLDYVNTTMISCVGFTKDNSLIIEGRVLADTKKEAEARYTIVKSDLIRVLTSMGYKKPKAIDKLKMYFQTV